MKIAKKTKIKIRKAVAFARTAFLMLFFLFVALAICSVDSESLKFPIICSIIGVICFGISYILDHLLFETAWSGDKKSPYIR